MMIGAVERIIMQSVIKSVMDYNNSIEMLDPGVKKYFKDNFDDVWCTLHDWHLIDNGNNIELAYTKQYLNGTMEHDTDIVPTETIVCIAVGLTLKEI